MGLCPKDVIQEQKKNINLVNLWFHREILHSEDLQEDEKYFYEQNDFFQFYTRSVYDYRKNQLFIATWIYNTYNTSLILAAPGQSYNYTGISFDICIPGKRVVDYDPRCRAWYKQALQQEGQVFIEPYQFSFDGNIGMTISSKIFDDFGNMRSIISIDYDISDLITSIFQPQDQNQDGDQQGYTVFFHEKNMTIFYHKLWNRYSKQIFSWPDLEYGSNLTYPNVKEEKSYFEQQVTKSIQFAHTYNYSIEKMENIDNFFIPFEKNGVKFFCLIYPIKVTSIVYAEKDKRKNSIVMFVGRVNKDLRYMFQKKGALTQYDSSVILFIIFCALMHYAAVLYYQIDIPLRMLQTYFIQELTRQKISNFGQEIKPKVNIISKKSNQKKKEKKKGNAQGPQNQKDQESIQQFMMKSKDKKTQFQNVNKSNNQFAYKTQNNQENSFTQQSNILPQNIFQQNNSLLIQQLKEKDLFLNSQFLSHLNQEFSFQNQISNELQNSPVKVTDQSLSKDNKQILNKKKNINSNLKQKLNGNLNQPFQSQNLMQSNQNLVNTQQNPFNYIDQVTAVPILANRYSNNENYSKSKNNPLYLSPQKQMKNSNISQYQYFLQNQDSSNNQRSFFQNGFQKYLGTDNNSLKAQCHINMNNKLDSQSQNIFKTNYSPGRKLTGSKGRMYMNRKIQEKQEERSHNLMVARQIRQIAIFSEKDMKQVLNIKLDDIPIMFHEMEIIISAIQEFAHIMEYLEGGYEETQDEWEKITRLRSALKVFRYVKNFNAQVLVYKEIGNIFLDKEDFKQCIEYYQQSLTISLLHNQIPSIQTLFSFFGNCNYTNTHNLDPNYLRGLLPTLYVCGFAISEIGFSLNQSIYEKNSNTESINWLKHSKEYLNTSFNICNLINLNNLKKIEIQIFIKLTLSEVNAHLNDLCSAQNEFKMALQLLQILKQEIEKNQSKSQQIFFKHEQLSNYFQLIQGIFLIKQEKYYLACLKFTNYLEFSSVLYFRKKALKYIKNTFEKFNVINKKIDLMYNRFQNLDNYSVFILFQSASNVVYSNTNLSNSPQFKNRGNGPNKNKQILNEIAWTQSFQENIFNYLKNTFLKKKDKVFLAGYDQEFKILQHLFPFENKPYLMRSQKIVGDFLFKNDFSSKLNQKISREYSSNMNNISMSNNYQLNQNNQEIDKRKDRFTTYGTLLSRKDSNQITHSEDYETIFQPPIGPQMGWEEAFFNLQNEIIKHYNQKQLLKENNFQKNKKILLVTFCFYSSQQPIIDKKLFKERLKFMTKMMPQQPKMLNFFLPLVRKQSNATVQKSQIIENHSDEMDQSSLCQKGLLNYQINKQMTNDFSTLNGENSNLIAPIFLNQTKFFPNSNQITDNNQSIRNLKENQDYTISNNQLNSFTRDLLNNSKGDSLNQKEGLLNPSMDNSELFKLSQSNDSPKSQKSLEDQFIDKIEVEKYKNKLIRNKQTSNQFSNFYYQELQSQKNKETNQVFVGQDQKYQEKKIMNQANSIPALINFDFSKFYIFSNQSQMYYYLSKLRHKNIDFHKVFDGLFK